MLAYEFEELTDDLRLIYNKCQEATEAAGYKFPFSYSEFKKCLGVTSEDYKAWISACVGGVANNNVIASEQNNGMAINCNGLNVYITIPTSEAVKELFYISLDGTEYCKNKSARDLHPAILDLLVVLYEYALAAGYQDIWYTYEGRPSYMNLVGTGQNFWNIIKELSVIFYGPISDILEMANVRPLYAAQLLHIPYETLQDWQLGNCKLYNRLYIARTLGLIQ